jgi:Domain of unknown function (DUF4350)
MRNRLVIIVSIALVLGFLIVLNTANYADAKDEVDKELVPNRSTYNAGATGTRALYDLLNESGYKVTRWRESSNLLLGQGRNQVSTFVIVGRTLLPIVGDEAKNLSLWVERGGRLVIIDRLPDDVLPKSGSWIVKDEFGEYPAADTDPANADDMTRGIEPIHPEQPTLLTQSVQSVRLSRFAATIRINHEKAPVEAKSPEHGGSVITNTPRDTEPPPESGTTSGSTAQATAEARSPAPVVHLRNSKGPVLVDYAYGAGRIIVLSDPYVVSNGGIRLDDNLQLALNTVAGSQGLIAFDEYHQGRGAAHNALATYFAGTPVLAIAGQITLIVLVLVWTRGRRFGRALPLAQVDRRSSLEFVASMAELQHRARALDLAIENIYARTRRVLTRYAGVDYHSSRAEIAERVASRSSLNREQLESLMRDCEETINGAAINEKQSIELVRRLRDVEGALGLRMRSREARQAAEKI